MISRPATESAGQQPGEQLPADGEEQLLLPGLAPSLAELVPRSGEGLALSATAIELYRICPLKYKFARVLAIRRRQTTNQRFGILIHQVLERFHAEQMGLGVDAPPASGEGDLQRLLELFDAGWERSGFRSSDEDLRLRELAVQALRRYHERQSASEASPVWLERGFEFAIGPHRVRGRVDRVDRLPDGEHELIDYKTGRPKAQEELIDDVQLPLYRLGAREDWGIEAKLQSYYYVLEDVKVPLVSSEEDTQRVERTVLEVAAGIEALDFEPKPSPEVCGWCDFRTSCPAAAA